MPIVSISAPDAVVKEADALSAALGYGGRSEFVRAALREFIQLKRGELERRGRVTASVTLAYREGSERRVADAKHEHASVVKSTLHAHAGAHECVEILMAHGDAAEVSSLVERLRGLRDVRALNVFYL